MAHHAFIDESTRGDTYIICVVEVSTAGLTPGRRELRTLPARGQRRIHFATESDSRRRNLLSVMSGLETTSTIYVAKNRSQVVARAAILEAAVARLQKTGCIRLVLEARDGQDNQDRAVIYRTLGRSSDSSMTYDHHQPHDEPMLWVPDAVAWAWGRGGHWRKRVETLGLVGAVVTVKAH